MSNSSRRRLQNQNNQNDIPWEAQVQMLLAEKNVPEALELSKNWHQSGLSREAFKQTFERIQQQAGFIELLRGNHQDARRLFIEGNLHVRELLCLFPFLMPTVFAYVPITPPLHQIGSSLLPKDHSSDKGAERERDALEEDVDCDQLFLSIQMFAVDYLTEVKLVCPKMYSANAKVIDTSLAVLCARLSGDEFIKKLTILVTDSTSAFESKALINTLQDNQLHHALALYYFNHHEPSGREMALEIWRNLQSKLLQDESFPGLNFIIRTLSEMNDVDLLLRNVDFVLEQDESEAVAIFTSRTVGQNVQKGLEPQFIVEVPFHFHLS